MMKLQFCLVIFFSMTVIGAFADQISRNAFAAIGQIHSRDERGANIAEDVKEKRLKRSSITIIDGQTRSDVVATFNDLRGKVGASDMNYVNWDSTNEDVAANWTKQCNYDNAHFYGSSGNYYIKAITGNDSTLADVIRSLFDDPTSSNYYNSIRSNHVTGICGVKSTCSPGIAGGTSYRKLYLYSIVLSFDNGFNSTLQQYTQGAACTRCKQGVNWCYNNLCRADCTNSTYGCCTIATGNTTSICFTTPAPTTTTTSSKGSAFSLEIMITTVFLGMFLSAIFSLFQ